MMWEVSSANDELTAGDPMELALAQLAQQAGLSRPDLLEQMPEVERDAFDRDTKQMATVHQTGDGYFVAR
jgi:Ca2+-transporting ATPase